MLKRGHRRDAAKKKKTFKMFGYFLDKPENIIKNSLLDSFSSFINPCELKKDIFAVDSIDASRRLLKRGSSMFNKRRGGELFGEWKHFLITEQIRVCQQKKVLECSRIGNLRKIRFPKMKKVMKKWRERSWLHFIQRIFKKGPFP